MKKILFLLFPVLLFGISSCKKDNSEEEPYKGKNYFPVNTGHELIYEVDLITKSNFTGLWDSAHFQIKEVIAGTYLDNEGRETQRIERFIKNDTTPDWTIYKVWASNLLTSTGQRVEDNIRYIKLYFPQYKDKNWDGNVQNTLGTRYYKYTDLHVPLTMGSLTFDSTCTVLQYEDTTLINSNFYQEKYATNVGMIYRINRDISYNYCGLPSCDTILDAYIYQETLVSFIK